MQTAPELIDLAQYLLTEEARQLTPSQLETLAAFARAHGPATPARYRQIAGTAKESSGDAVSAIR
jgi:DNA-binding MarR family transcriptional regulator